MKKAVSFKRYDSQSDKVEAESLQDAIIKKWAFQKKVEIVREFADVSLADRVFETKAWKELEAFVKQNPTQINFIVSPKFSTLCETNIKDVMGKAEIFVRLGIEMSIASKE